jgi:hypothetical protein
MQSEYGDVNHILVPLDVLPNFATLSVDPDALAVEWLSISTQSGPGISVQSRPTPAVE